MKSPLLSLQPSNNQEGQVKQPMKPVSATGSPLQTWQGAPAAAPGTSDGYALFGAPPVCHCGAKLTLCTGCWSERCLRCDPYSSDDCRFRDF
jgi:hypothetical protein